ncbi:MAG TPA: hypothetical protein VN667_11345 [Burkholderiales bacterium]|nr:hypothetical protein [Burkholderiales bacterium]
MRERAIALLLLCISAPAGAVGWFSPPEESLGRLCVKSALAAFPGKVERMSVKSVNRAWKVRVYLEQNDGQERIVFCDALSGVIEKSVVVDDLYP